MIEYLAAHPWLLMIGIFLLRIVDQTIGTLRMISVVRGYPVIAVLMGFLEVFIWINVIGQVIQNLDAWYLTIGYAAGFAAGQAVGMWVERKLALGNQLVRVISRTEVDLARKLWENNYPVVEIPSTDRSGPVDVVFVVEGRENIPALTKLIAETDPQAFYTVEDVRLTSHRPSRTIGILDLFPWLRWQEVVKKR
ncbi:DUF2179 domain-containing protein [bacterium]|nr:DUF2179 domain-containing protein [bacterium]MBU1985407.1 DUF2179 domain-containing protein [bacterium]